MAHYLKLDYSILDYDDYTDDNYVLCQRMKLDTIDFSEFVVEHYDVKGEFHVNSRFFY